MYASFVELADVPLHIDITTGQPLHACLIVRATLTYVIACAFFLRNLRLCRPWDVGVSLSRCEPPTVL